MFVGGTELDDWPGGIKQKYNVLSNMLYETMNALNFDPINKKKREFLDGENGVQDAVGEYKGN